MNLKARLAKLEGNGDFLSIGEIMDRLDSGEPIERVDPALIAALAAMEA
ncbi:MAG: hypothetical protein IPH79_09145 [Sphingomonadales bacterium]|nr:hypothetical protein [Sphingomonadales bacterium]